MKLLYLKLKSNSELLGILVEETKKTVTIEFPIEVFISQEQSISIPWGFLLSDQDTFKIKKSDCYIISEANSDAYEFYSSAFSEYKKETQETITYH